MIAILPSPCGRITPLTFFTDQRYWRAHHFIGHQQQRHRAMLALDNQVRNAHAVDDASPRIANQANLTVHRSNRWINNAGKLFIRNRYICNFHCPGLVIDVRQNRCSESLVICGPVSDKLHADDGGQCKTGGNADPGRQSRYSLHA